MGAPGLNANVSVTLQCLQEGWPNRVMSSHARVAAHPIHTLYPSALHNAVLTAACPPQDVALTLLFAGWETTASSMCFLFKHLHAHPEVMRALREEQKQVRHRLHSGHYVMGSAAWRAAIAAGAVSWCT